MTRLETLLIAVMALWLLLTIVYQVFPRQLAPYTQRWDLFRWLPAYDLFAGTPRTLQLSFRDQLVDGSMTDWCAIEICSKHRWRHAIWHPEGRRLDVVGSLVDDLIKIIENQSSSRSKGVSDRFVYLGILRFVLCLPRAERVTGRQFKIEQSEGYIATRPSKQLFCSRIHSYEAVCGS